MSKELIESYEKVVNEITLKFIEIHFSKDEVPCFYWVALDVGGVLEINDYYFSFYDILEFLKLKSTTEQVFNYYDYSLECCYDKSLPKLNIKNFLKCKK